jgi:hypothetical protein
MKRTTPNSQTSPSQISPSKKVFKPALVTLAAFRANAQTAALTSA